MDDKDIGIKRKENGGIHIEKKDIIKLFDFLDEGNKQHITESDLRRKLPLFYKALPPKDYRILMNNKTTLNIDELYNILSKNELSNFDPINEAFKVLDTKDNGYIEISKLKLIFYNLGWRLSSDDLNVLISVADYDNDGKINLNDFKRLLKTSNELNKKLNEK